MNQMYTNLPANYQDQSELKEYARGDNNGQQPIFNPGCWPENATVAASASVDCPIVSGTIVRYFHSDKELETWLDSLNPGDLFNGMVVRWDADEEFDVDAMFQSAVRI